MAAYVPVPRDLSRVKQKIIFNLTARQLACFGAAAVIGLPVFFLVRGATGNVSLSAMAMMALMLPLFFLAMYEKDGQPPEVVMRHIIETKFIRPRIRPYRTDNYYRLLERQARAEKEVDEIVRKHFERRRGTERGKESMASLGAGIGRRRGTCEGSGGAHKE